MISRYGSRRRFLILRAILTSMLVPYSRVGIATKNRDEKRHSR